MIQKDSLTGESTSEQVQTAESEESKPGSTGQFDAFLPDPAAVNAALHKHTPKSSFVGMRSARVTALSGRRVTLLLRGQSDPVDALVAPEVDPMLVADARLNGDSVLVEQSEGQMPLVIAVLQTQKPREIHLKAATIHIEGDQEVLLRSGKGAIRIREDGDIEVIGSRISAASRGLFRLVGRILRLN